MKKKKQRDPRYQRLLNSKRWTELRRKYIQQHPLCERCLADGYVTPSVDLHHKTPVESCKTIQEMERVCYDPNNLQALCVACHVKTHIEMGKNKTVNIKQRQELKHDRWVEAMNQRFENDDRNREG